MLAGKNTFAALTLLLLVFTFAVPQVSASGSEYKAIVGHLKTKYRAKKVRIPFLWLARFAVRIARPAGVKSFSVTMFENLQFSRKTLDGEMQGAMRNSLGAEWSPILRVRSREGQQAYMYMRDAGDSVKILLVTIDKNQAAVIRAKFSPDKFAEFINEPKVMGISLNDNNQAKTEAVKPPENSAPKNDPAETGAKPSNQ